MAINFNDDVCVTVSDPWNPGCKGVTDAIKYSRKERIKHGASNKVKEQKKRPVQ